MKLKVKAKSIPILRYPDELAKSFASLLTLHAVEAIVMDLTSFLFQISKNNLVNGLFVPFLIAISAYYLREPIAKLLSHFFSQQMSTHDKLEVKALGAIAGEVLFFSRGKATKKDGFTQKMSSKDITFTTRKSIQLIWNQKIFWYKNSIKFISTIVMLIGFFRVTTLEIKNVVPFFLVTAFGIVVNVLCAFKWIAIVNKRRAASRKASMLTDNAEQDILNVEPISHEHARFMIRNFVNASNESFELRKKTNGELSLFKTTESLIMAVVRIGIVVITIFEAGINKASLDTFATAVALIAIYDQMLSRTSSLVDIFYDYRDMQEEEKVYDEDFRNIIEIYEKGLAQEQLASAKLISFTITPFCVRYKAENGNNAFTLLNNTPIVLRRGDFVVLTGPTGGGKTTLSSLVAQQICFEEFNPSIETESEGTVKALLHQTFISLGGKTLLEELTFGNESYDQEKLFYILEKLHLLDEFKQKNSDVVALLTSTTKEQFSAGQLQRLALARTLFNLSDEIQIIAFDEATNNLNDQIALKTLEFISEFCKDKLTLFSTHQVNLFEQIATKRLNFIQTDVNTYTVTSVI